jgi:hypothetical protein
MEVTQGDVENTIENFRSYRESDVSYLNKYTYISEFIVLPGQK